MTDDPGTYERDLEWGDLDMHMPGTSAGKSGERAPDPAAGFRRTADHPAPRHPHPARSSERRDDFSFGFEAITDYWRAP